MMSDAMKMWEYPDVTLLSDGRESSRPGDVRKNADTIEKNA